jgi:preprotein translocase subunit SecD
VLLVSGLVLLLGVIIATAVVVVVNRSDGKRAAASTARTKPSDPTAVQFRRVLSAKAGTCPTPAPAGTACDAKGMRYTLGKVELDGSNVTEVKTGIQENGGNWYVGLTLDSEGTKLFAQLTTALAKQTPPSNQLAIVVDDQVVTAPSVMSPITAGKIEISGGYTRDSAEELATKITG